MKIKLLIALSLLISNLSYSQTTATNFNSTDCSGTNHNLFAELEAGKVIVICWVMPCGACLTPAITAYEAVNEYQLSNPNKVFFYLADDVADNSCSDIDDWATEFGIPASSYSKRFSDASVNMNNYGTYGMPKTVVIAGFSHKIFYNQNDAVNATEIQTSINQALIASVINDINSSSNILQICPNPANQSTKLSISLQSQSKNTIEIFNSHGKKIADIPTTLLLSNENTFTINTSEFNEGVYYIRLNNNKLTSTQKLIIVH